MASQSDLRRQLRATRRALSDAERLASSNRICDHLYHSAILRGSRRIAAYLPMHGEVDLRPFISRAEDSVHRLYLPAILAPFQNQLRFAPFDAKRPLVRNRLGIPEPAVNRHELLQAKSLDVVLMPLVGFDAAGTRIGMGGGFYDRTFAFRLHRNYWRKPLLIGVAYDFQRVSGIERQRWDVPMDHVVTESGWLF